MLFAVQRPENELSSVVEVIEEILESPRLEWPLFVSGATICVRWAEQRFLTNVAYTNEIRRERVVVIKRIESVRMEQPDRSEEEMALSRSMGGNVRLHRRTEHDIYSL